VTLGSLDVSARTDSVNLLAGSLTSISGAGLIMPYGGTVDGIVYRYDGTALDPSVGGVTGKISSAVNLGAAHVTTEAGSTIDLSGGGELTGAGFVSGRGGSVDILTTPLASANPGYGFSSTGNNVYAIVPSSNSICASRNGERRRQSARRPTGHDPGGRPRPGCRNLYADASDLCAAAGPSASNGAGGQAGLRGVTALGNGSYAAAGILGVTNTKIRDALPSQVIITPADVVRTHSSYNETSYNAFLRSDAARLGVPRTMLTVDGGTLGIGLFKKLEDDAREALSIAGDIRFAPQAKTDGFGGLVAVTGLSEVLAADQTAAQGLSGASVRADALSALKAPRLLINAALLRTYGQSGRYASIIGDEAGNDLVIRSGAEIVAGDVILANNRRYFDGAFIDGAITIEEGASIIARDNGARAFD
jgi:hypothetical protein